MAIQCLDIIWRFEFLAAVSESMGFFIISQIEVYVAIAIFIK